MALDGWDAEKVGKILPPGRATRFATTGTEFVLVLDADGKAEFLRLGGRTMQKQR